MGFLVRNNLQVTETKQFNERIFAITIRKIHISKPCQLFKVQKLFVIKKFLLTVINVHAPHMGITQSNGKKKQTDDIYKQLETVRKNYGRDVIVLGDFNTKLSKRNHMDNAVDSHSRGRRKEI